MIYQSKLMLKLGIVHGVQKKSIPGAVAPKQIHGDKIVKVSTAPQSPECDGISTNAPIALTVMHADCQPALFYDPKQQAIALVHCGWRGNVQNIYAKTVEHMKMEYNTNPADLYLSIGPSLGPENSEFLHYKTEFPESFWKYQWSPNHFDLWKIAHDQATQAGIPADQIEMARIDTFADSNLPSYRRDKTKERMVTFASLNPF